MNKDDWHTKARCPKQGLHRVIHRLGDNKEKQVFRNGITIVKDPRFINGRDGHWPLRVELESIYDKIIKTKIYIVVRNEYGKREFYPKFYQKMKEKDMTLDNYKHLLNANKDGLWKKHPMRAQRNQEDITCIPLKFNMSKKQWSHVLEKKSSVDVTITRQLGKDWNKYLELGKEVVAYTDSNGLFNISEGILKNWWLVNPSLRKKSEDDLAVEQSRRLIWG